MEPWILIVWLYLDRGGAAFSQEFTSKDSCVVAMNKVLEMRGHINNRWSTVFCVPK